MTVTAIKNWPRDFYWSRDGQRLMAATAAGLEQWDVGTEQRAPHVRLVPAVGKVDELAYSSSGELLAIDSGNTITIWDTSNWKWVARIQCAGSGGFMQFSHDDKTLFVTRSRRSTNNPGSVSLHSVLTRWDLVVGKLVSTENFEPDGLLEALSPDGRYGVISTTKDSDRVYDLETREKVLKERPIKWLRSSVFSGNGDSIISYQSRQVRILSVPSGAEQKHFRVVVGGNTGDDSNLSISMDGRLLAAGGGFPDAHLVSLIDLKAGNVLDVFECGPEGSICQLVRLSPNGRSLATLTAAVNVRDQPTDSVLKIWMIPDSW